MSFDDSAIFLEILAGEGASNLTWEVATRCSCYSIDTAQPKWGCPTCGGYGAIYAAPLNVRALVGSRSAWRVPHVAGQFTHGEARLTTFANDFDFAGVTYPACEPGYVDDRVRDRFAVVDAAGDVAPGRVFLPVAKAVPFIFANVQRAWRVQITALDNLTERLIPQP